MGIGIGNEIDISIGLGLCIDIDVDMDVDADLNVDIDMECTTDYQSVYRSISLCTASCPISLVAYPAISNTSLYPAY